jgi:alkylation response protein AidB-like acyl-CoA dehydrogenase
MDFGFSEVQQMIRDEARDFARKEISLACADWDREERFPQEVVRALGALGMLAVMVPEEWEGPGSDPVALVALVEELARMDGSLATIAAIENGLIVPYITHYGSSAQQEEWLTPLASGERLVAWALADREQPRWSRKGQVTVQHKGSTCSLEGEIPFVSLATVADSFLVFARETTGENEWSAFHVEARAEGVRCEPLLGQLGLRATGCGHLFLEGVTVSEKAQVGRRGEALAHARQTQQYGRTALAAVSVGVARGALEEAVAYSRERRQFGRPLADFQAIQWKVAEMGMGLDAARLLVYQAASTWMKGASPESESRLARFYSARVASLAAGEALQIHGGYGYTNEFPLERYYRDAKTLEALDEGMEIQRLQVTRSMMEERGE